MKWYKGYIEAAGNILVGAKRENGEYLPVENIEVYVNPFTGSAVKKLIHINRNIDKTITTYEVLIAGDHKLYIFPEFKEVNPFEKPEKEESFPDTVKKVIRRGKK